MFHSLVHGLLFSLSTQTQVLICPNWWFLYEWDLACNFLNEPRTRVIRIFKNFIFHCPWCGAPCLFSGHHSVYELATLCFFLPSLFPALSISLACQHFHRWSGRRNKTSQLLKNCYMKDKTGTVLITFWSIKFFLLYRSNISLRKVQSKSLLTFSLYFHFSNATSVLVYFFRYFYAHMNSIYMYSYILLLAFLHLTYLFVLIHKDLFHSFFDI